jgi:hypothetical protein
VAHTRLLETALGTNTESKLILPFMSHNFRVLSLDPDARMDPSLEKLQQATYLSWPSRTLLHLPEEI